MAQEETGQNTATAGTGAAVGNTSAADSVKNAGTLDRLKKGAEYKLGQMQGAEKEQYEKDLKEMNEKKMCDRCNEYKQWVLQYSPSVRFMVEQIQKAGGSVDLGKLNCEICAQPKHGGYHPVQGIQLCANYIPDKWVMNDTLSHELIHWYDQTRFYVDWLNLRHYACTEIRAASLSGECAIMTEFKKHMKNHVPMRVAKGHQKCVKRLATLSVMGHPACKDQKQAEEVVDEVFRSCFNDTRPYEHIYR